MCSCNRGNSNTPGRIRTCCSSVSASRYTAGSPLRPARGRGTGGSRPAGRSRDSDRGAACVRNEPNVTYEMMFWGLSPRVRRNRGLRRGGETPSRVYPRVGGGTSWKKPRARWSQGLSPRGRGEPSGRKSAPFRTWVYPRVGGGTPSTVQVNRMASGLSSRGRGNRRERQVGPTAHGSIPVCTGEPARTPSRRTQSEVYPRVYGGTDHKHPLPTGATGLSPCVRGTDTTCRFMLCTLGLSPRGRGNPFDGAGEPHGLRSIPAWVGEPCTRS